MARKRSGTWAKWERAKRHLEALRDELGPSDAHPWGWAHTYTPVPEAHRNGLEYRFYVEPVELDTTEWALMAGDCLFNLRSALDHLVFDLHLRRFRGKVPDKIAGLISFPILSTDPKLWKRRSKDPAKWPEIRHLGAKQRRAIAWLQPYNGRDDKLRRIRRSLDLLSTLNNVDKHRHLNVLEASPQTASVGGWHLSQFGFCQQTFFGEPLIGKTEVFRWTFTTVPPDIAHQLNIQGNIRAFICLYESGEKPAPLLLPLLDRLAADVRSVIERFAVFLR